MTWNPDAPTNEVRISLLAYLRIRADQLATANLNCAAAAAEIGSLRRWIAWLDGQSVQL
jgi:hypothetical protein